MYSRRAVGDRRRSIPLSFPPSEGDLEDDPSSLIPWMSDLFDPIPDRFRPSAEEVSPLPRVGLRRSWKVPRRCLYGEGMDPPFLSWKLLPQPLLCREVDRYSLFSPSNRTYLPSMRISNRFALSPHRRSHLEEGLPLAISKCRRRHISLQASEYTNLLKPSDT